MIFKGGTSLSKVYDIIHRFSEDVDLSLDREQLGFKAFASAAATLNGIEVAHMIRKGQFTPGLCPFRQFAELAA